MLSRKRSTRLQLTTINNKAVPCNRLKLGVVRFLLACVFVFPALLMADEQQAATEYLEAKSLIASARYAEALSTLRKLQLRYPRFSQLASVQTRIAVLQEHRDAGQSLPVFIAALDLRDEQQADRAVLTLDGLIDDSFASSLADDALYMKAYILLMDLYRFEEARDAIETLWQQYPDTAYTDSAAYLDAIALEQLGHTDQARLALRVLRNRHTALSLPFGFYWPSSDLMSRYWFDRADRRLAILERQSEIATKLRSKNTSVNGAVLMDVVAEGQQFSLTLAPSEVVSAVRWTNELLEKQAPPALAIYSGVVTGEPNSWARITVDGQRVSGMVSVDGQRWQLQSDQMLGTLNYYKSGTRPDSSMSAAPDYLQAPIPAMTLQARAAQQNASTRLIPISIAIDAEFNNYYGGQGVAQALNNINMADGIYREQGVAFSVDQVQSFTSDSPVKADASGTLESILLSFRDYRLQQRTLFDDSVLVYLFTGADTSDNTLGLAWIDTLCRLDGYDVGVTTPSNYADVLTAHELGHSLGALHDSETDCQAESQKIMWPRISASTQAQFSSCSQNKVHTAKLAQCLLNSIDLQLTANLSDQLLRLNVRNSDSLISTQAVVYVEAVGATVEWPSTCLEQAPGSAECAVGDIPAGATETIDLVVLSGGNALVTAQASQINVHDHEPVNNAVSVELETGLITQSIPFSEPTTTVAPPPSSSGGSGRLGLMFVMLLGLLGLSRQFRRSWRAFRFRPALSS